MKPVLKTILSGLVLGVFLPLLFVGNILLFKRIGLGVINRLDKSYIKQQFSFNKIRNNFYLSFENDEELDIFMPNNTGIKRDTRHATDRQYSLMIDFPPGPEYPGISFDMYGHKLMDWSSIESFSFDVFNATPASRTLTVQIRSGPKYPKKGFKKEFKMPANGPVKAVIKKDEMASKIDLDRVSHITIFMSNPRTSHQVFIDNMRVQ